MVCRLPRSRFSPLRSFRSSFRVKSSRSGFRLFPHRYQRAKMCYSTDGRWPKKREVSGRQGKLEVLQRLFGSVCRAHCLERRKRQACRWKAEAQFGGPSRNSDERSGS